MSINSYIYNGERYCEECADAIKARIREDGCIPRSWIGREDMLDSLEWPQGPYSDEESDVPDHCGAGQYCLDPHIFPSGFQAGKFLESSLTREGVRYVQDLHESGPTEVTAFWLEFYGITPHPPEGSEVSEENE